jgi:hypothetical protein
MNLLETLKQFKRIEPDRGYTERSKRTIIAMHRPAPRPTSVFVMALRVFETGAAVVLAGFFILLITGNLSNSPLAPVQYSVIDPNSLRAEAQAIDMQIELANVTYPQSPSTAESTAPVGTPATSQNLANAITAATSSPAAATGTATSTASSTLSIDQALQELAK